MLASVMSQDTLGPQARDRLPRGVRSRLSVPSRSAVQSCVHSWCRSPQNRSVIWTSTQNVARFVMLSASLIDATSAVCGLRLGQPAVCGSMRKDQSMQCWQPPGAVAHARGHRQKLSDLRGVVHRAGGGQERGRGAGRGGGRHLPGRRLHPARRGVLLQRPLPRQGQPAVRAAKAACNPLSDHRWFPSMLGCWSVPNIGEFKSRKTSHFKKKHLNLKTS